MSAVVPGPFNDGHDFHEVDAIAIAVANSLHPADYLLAVVATTQLREDMMVAIQSNELRAFRPGPVPSSPSWKPRPDERVVWVQDADAEAWLRGRKLSLFGTAPSAEVSQTESKEMRQARRLDRYEELGGRRRPGPGGGWKASGKRGALATLAREEAGKPYSDVRDMARDLDAEAARRRAGQAMPRG